MLLEVEFEDLLPVPTTMPLFHNHYPSGTISPNKPFLLEVAFVMVFHHNNGKIINTPICFLGPIK